jgi:integrase
MAKRKRRRNGDGGITRRRDGRWMGRFSLANGRRRTFYGSSDDDVARQIREFQHTVDIGLTVSPENPTVEAFLGGWLSAMRPSVRSTTWQRYEGLLRHHAIPEIGKVRLSKLTPLHVQRLYASRLEAGLSPTTVRHLHTVLHRALGHAVKWGLLPRNPIDLVDAPKMAQTEMVALTREQTRRLLEAARGERLESLYVLALTTGMRQGELFALRWRHVDLDRGVLQVRGTMQQVKGGPQLAEPKTRGSRRQIQLTSAAVQALREHRVRQNAERLKLGAAWEDQDLVFPNYVGRPLTPGNLVQRSFYPLLAKAGIPRVRFHDLRHTAATLLLEQGVHPKVVSEMLGHSTIAITLDLYSHVTPTMQKQAAEAMDRLLST